MRTFAYHSAGTLDEAISLLTKYNGKAKIIAGGTDILGAMKDEINPEYPEATVSIKTIPGINYIKEEDNTLKIGALTSLTSIACNNIVTAKYLALAQAADSVGSPQIRNMGTLGGNLCQEVRCWYYRLRDNQFYCLRKGGKECYAVAGDNRYNAIIGAQGCFAVCPSDTAVALTALNATMITNKRNIPIGEFYQPLGNVLEANEIVTEVQIPAPQPGTKQTFLKFSIRKSIDFAVTSVGTVVTVAGGIVADARIVLGAVSPMPYRATYAEAVVKGNRITESVAEETGAMAVKCAKALSKNGYVIQITKTLVKRALLALNSES